MALVGACRKTHNNKLSKKFFQIQTGFTCSSKKFKEIVKTNIDPHKILDNFRQIKNYSEECPRHHTGGDSMEFQVPTK